jgi:uncharacterized membrane protein
MPYEWIKNGQTAPVQTGAVSPLAELHLWPYRSLPKRGFVSFMGITCALVLLPMTAVIGSPVVWGVLPFFVIAIGATWFALNRSYRDGSIIEQLRLWPDRIVLVRHAPRRRPLEWEANPHWVTLAIHPDGGPVAHYVTLSGGGREVEIGAFLSEEERKQLYDELRERLRLLR